MILYVCTVTCQAESSEQTLSTSRRGNDSALLWHTECTWMYIVGGRYGTHHPLRNAHLRYRRRAGRFLLGQCDCRTVGLASNAIHAKTALVGNWRPLHDSYPVASLWRFLCATRPSLACRSIEYRASPKKRLRCYLSPRSSVDRASVSSAKLAGAPNRTISVSAHGSFWPSTIAQLDAAIRKA